MLAGRLSRFPVGIPWAACMDILNDDGALAPEMVAAKADPDLLDAAEWVQRCSPPELAATTLTQVALWRRAREKLLMTDRVSLTPDGLE